jgi:hypothetical protein
MLVRRGDYRRPGATGLRLRQRDRRRASMIVMRQFTGSPLTKPAPGRIGQEVLASQRQFRRSITVHKMPG